LCVDQLYRFIDNRITASEAPGRKNEETRKQSSWRNGISAELAAMKSLAHSSATRQTAFWRICPLERADASPES